LGADVSQGIKLPLGINYVGSSSSQEIGNSTQTFYAYKGVKTKPKLFWFLGSANLFLDTLGEAYATSGFTTYDIRILNSDKSQGRSVRTAPIISHTMPMGMSDSSKINNDSACILFNSEQPVDVGVQTYNTYTENDSFNLFYSNRISNLYDTNTRFLNGYFDLKLNDIQNLRENDIIKIQEQYFIVNKINGFNLTNRELTQVELVQYNNNVQTYPTRYFKYQYCDAPDYCFKIKTDFTNPRLIDTQFGWSVWYDQSIGTFTGSTTPTGFTSTIRDSSTQAYVPFTISEITKDQYDNGGCYDISCDTLIDFEWNFVNVLFPNIEYAFGLGLPSFWQNAAGTYEGLNLWTSCSDFNTTRVAYGILTGSSINHGASPCIVTPTPTPTPGGPTPTPSPTPLPITSGSLFFYDPGNINSYPGSGSVLYDLSGNGRHANINTGITWVSGSAAYFNLNGNDNNSITGTTLNLSPTSWSMWMAVYRNDPQNYDGFMTEGTTDPITNGLYQLEASNRLDLRYHNGTQFIETGSGTLTTGSWNFIGGSIGTQRTRHIYKSGSLSNVSEAITPATSSFNEAIFIGEDAITGQDRTINGRIGPVIMFNRELTTSEFTDLDNYFKTRYGI
jgi:hypothetical protein